jgi:hypothetical protein
MKITPAKFTPGDRVYVNTPDGMVLLPIHSLYISIDEDLKQTVCYWIRVVGQGSMPYREDQIIINIGAAKKKLSDNLDQLQLALPSN